MIPYATQDIDESDLAEVCRVLSSDMLTQGKEISLFENALKAYVGSMHCKVFNSATSALHCACRALGIGEGDRVWTTAISFAASANAAIYCGAVIDFVDVDSANANLSVSALREKLEIASISGRLPKALIVVHLSGLPCDMIEIRKLSLEFGFYVIEDASHALGAKYNDFKVGSCQYSEVCIFSFHAVKMITTGEGGAALCNSEVLDRQLSLLRTHYIERNSSLLINRKEEKWYYEQQGLGFNYRITDFQCALGRSQLQRLPAFLLKRNAIAQYYNENLDKARFILPLLSPDRSSSFHLFIILIRDEFEFSRDEIYRHLDKAGIGSNLHYIPIYKHPYFQSLGFSSTYCRNAENIYSRCLSIPMHTKLSHRDLEYIVGTLNEM